MKVTISEAKHIASDALQALGYPRTEANTITEHPVESELRGYSSAGLARILSIADRLSGKKAAVETQITRQGPTSAQLDGKDTLGYLVALEATNLAIKKATETGIAVYRRKQYMVHRYALILCRNGNSERPRCPHCVKCIPVGRILWRIRTSFRN